MRILALVVDREHVCCRYRLAAFEPTLRQAGHSIQYVPEPKTDLGWWRFLLDVRKADVVIVQRFLLHPFRLTMLRAAAKKLLFDLDDAVFLRDSYHPRGLNCRTRQRRFAATVTVADGIIAGNSFLAHEALRWSHPHRVRIIPTCLDTKKYQPQWNSTTKTTDLVWIGSSSTLQGLEQITPLLEKVGFHHPGLHLRVICDRSFHLREMQVENVPWSQVTEAEQLTTAKIGISWLPEDRWSEGKCGLKLLQYGAAGLPVIANTVGMHNTLYADSRGGLLANTAEHWLRAIRILLADSKLCQTMGQHNRLIVEQHYSHHQGADAWLDMLYHLHRHRRVA